MKKSTIILYIAIITLLIFPLISATPRENATRQYIPRQVDEIYVSLNDFKLLSMNNGRVVSRYPISTGVDTAPTPRGEFEIINKLEHPWYTPPDEEAKAPGPDNPLGSRWMGINKPSYGIHGTKEPEKIGSPASDGCIRLYNRHVELLYDRVKPGTKVIIKEELPEQLVQEDPLVTPPDPILADSGEQ